MSYPTFGGLALGVFLFFFYLWYGWFRSQPTTLANAGVVFLGTEGIVGGLRLIFFVLDPELRQLAAKREISLWYIVLGGLALLFLSGQTIIGPFRKKP